MEFKNVIIYRPIPSLYKLWICSSISLEFLEDVMKNKIVALLIAAIMILSMFPSSSFAFVGINNSQPEQSLGMLEEETDSQPDISDAMDIVESMSASERKLSSNLLQLTDSKYLPDEITQNEIINQMKEQGQIKEKPVTNGTDGHSSAYNVYVYIKLEKGCDPDILSQYVSQVINQDIKNRLVVVWTDINSLENIASLSEVQSIREVTSPVVKAGSFTSEGDTLLKADLTRAMGVDGTGIKVGIISDGVDSYSDAVASGDLPAGLTVLSNVMGGDEGTAMLEIVHDLAPNADLYFHDHGSSVLDFNDAIDALANAGCDIICDDIGWITEPFFEDGVVAQHVENLISTTDIIYITSAGNSADSHYQGQFHELENGIANFSNETDPEYPYLYASVQGGDQLRAVMQWDEPSGGAGNDYNLALFDYYTGDLLAQSTYIQDGDDDPVEFVVYENSTGEDTIVVVLAYAYDAPVDKTLELYVYGVSMYADNIVETDSIFGHAAVPGVLSCGAINQAAPDEIEWFSSCGPVTMLTETRQKPDICGIDGVSITGAGGFGSYDSGTYRFYGTSASAPHIAAVAALLKSRFTSMSETQLKQLILDNGIDLGDAGYDTIFGYGRADAYAAATSRFTVTFDSQGGSAVDSQYIESGGTVTEPDEPTKTNYDFEGWYKEEACTNPWDFENDTVTADTTLYAKYYSPAPSEDFVYTDNGDGTCTIDDYTGSGGDLVIPSSLNGLTVTIIESFAFCEKNISNLVIPNSVTEIMQDAFSSNNITTLTIPGNVTYIGETAFADNDITSITIEEGVELIGDGTFMSNNIQSVFIPDSVRYIGCQAFYGNNITTVNIGSGVKWIDWAAFNDNQLTSVSGGGTSDGIIYARNEDCSIDNTTIVSYGGASDVIDFIPNSVTTIGIRAFLNNEITEVVIPVSVEEIRMEAFKGNSLTEVTLPNSVIHIGMYAFNGNTLTDFTLPTPDSVNFVEWTSGSASYNGGDTVTAANSEPYIAQFENIYFNGLGTSGDPYQISNADDLAQLASLVNAGDAYYTDEFYVQTEDIDLSGIADWTPIGDSLLTPFEGSYDGGNHSISNLSIDANVYVTPDMLDSFGLFGYASGEIKNLHIDGGTISVTTSEDVYVGSIVGQFNGGSVQNCSSSATIGVGTNSKDHYVYGGGVIGAAYDNNVIKNCSYSGSMSAVNSYQSGGYIGGIVGSSWAATITVRDCYNTGSIYGEGIGMRAAGIIGRSIGNSLIERCFNTGDVTSHLTRNYYGFSLCGGIVSESSSTNITDCFNLGTITASGAEFDVSMLPGAGGIAADYGTGTIENCYNAGMVYAENCGGIGGELQNWDVTLIGCYYADTCELTDRDGNFSANKCTLEQMKQQTTFAEFDFINTWEIVEGEYYPVLQDLPFTYTTDLSISQSTEELSVSETIQLTATVNPAEATSQSVVWASDNDSVAAVDKTGLVTAKKVGTATITATTADGGFSETCDITVPGYSLDIYGNGSVIRFEDGEDAIINGSPSVTYTDILLICGSDVQLTLNNVNIDNSNEDEDRPAVIFSGSGNQLILHGTSTLRGGENEPAIRVDQDAALEISGSGSLYTYGGANAAGIGSGTGNAGSITISDGQITSTGGDNGAGIGSGNGSDVASITISGGSVNALGGYRSAGVGSGSAGTAESIAISGGTINAVGDECSAGIGGGYYGQSTSITISDGVVTADGSSAGIGGGYCGYSGLITISGGIVNATVSERDGYGLGSGIGGGNACSVNTINITGGTIRAVGRDRSAGIGGSYGTRINTISISGGRISAFGGDGDSTYNAGAGIGTGASWYSVDITISGGEIYACGGSDSYAGYNVDIGLAGYRDGGAGFPNAPVDIIGDTAVFLEHDVCGVKDGPYTHTHMDVSDPDAPTIFGVTMDDDWAPTGAWILLTTLKYDANGGKSAPESVIQHINTDVTVGNDGTMYRSGYEFVNWNTNSNGEGDTYVSGDTITLIDDITLFAIWRLTQIESSVYTVDQTNGLLKHVSVNTSVAQLKANLLNDAADIKVYDKEGAEYTDDNIASGMVVKLTINDTVRDELTVAVRGDVSGNGQIDIADYILIRSSLYGLINLNTLQFFSADVNENGNIDIADYILVRSHMYGLTHI